MQEFKNIFFDLGGVFFNLHRENAFLALNRLGFPIQEIDLSLAKTIQQMDQGAINKEQFLQIMRPQLHPGVTDEQIIRAYESMLHVPASRLALLKKLRSRYKVYLLSNISDIHWEASKRMAREAGIPVEECFDNCFCSYHLGVCKPDPKIFQKVIELSGVNPAESLYLDDADDNITAGKAAGLIAKKIESNHLEDYIQELFPEFA